VPSASEKPLLHLWSDSYGLTRRVLATSDHSDQRLALAVERFGCSKPARLEFIRLEFERAHATYPAKFSGSGHGDLRGIPSRRRLWQLFLFVEIFNILSCLRNALFRIPQAQ
jgi:hypothetical protein